MGDWLELDNETNYVRSSVCSKIGVRSVCVHGVFHLFDRKLAGGNRSCEGKQAFEQTGRKREDRIGQADLYCVDTAALGCLFKDFRMRRESLFNSEEVINKGCLSGWNLTVVVLGPEEH